ncbi:hypothetical protein T439DRAFT_326557 [Meredithblackwellia eburnea MCA 4105]
MRESSINRTVSQQDEVPIITTQAQDLQRLAASLPSYVDASVTTHSFAKKSRIIATGYYRTYSQASEDHYRLNPEFCHFPGMVLVLTLVSWLWCLKRDVSTLPLFVAWWMIGPTNITLVVMVWIWFGGHRYWWIVILVRIAWFAIFLYSKGWTGRGENDISFEIKLKPGRDPGCSSSTV